jgi:hypothetical protein
MGSADDFVTCGRFHIYFMRVTYGLSKTSCTVPHFQNELTYFPTVISFIPKMFGRFLKYFMSVTYGPGKITCTLLACTPMHCFTNFTSLYSTAIS